MTGDRIVIKFPGRPRYLVTVRDFFEVLTRERPEIRLDERARVEMQLVLQEACINAIRHGGAEDQHAPVEVAFLLEGDGLTIEVRDHGPGFDPQRVPRPAPESLQEGGYGVFIMKESMDRVAVRREGASFVLSLTKFYGEGDGPASVARQIEAAHQ